MSLVPSDSTGTDLHVSAMLPSCTVIRRAGSKGQVHCVHITCCGEVCSQAGVTQRWNANLVDLCGFCAAYFNVNVCCVTRWHSGTVVSTGLWVQTWQAAVALLCWVCVHSSCLCGCSPGTLASSPSPKTCNGSELPVALNVTVQYECVLAL